jgi:hypothetical protein
MTIYKNSIYPIQIIPFPDNTEFTKNEIVIKKPIYDKNDMYNDYDHIGEYIISSSSFQKGNNAYNAFNENDTIWESSESLGINSYNNYDYDTKTVIKNKYTYDVLPFGPSYYNSTNNTNIENSTILGEWIQIKLPKPFYLYSYCIKVPVIKNDKYPIISSNSIDKNKNLIENTSFFPKAFMLVGSNDGNSWDYLDQKTLINTPEKMNKFNEGYCYDKNRNEIRIQINSINNYSFYRFVVTALFPGNKNIKISNLSFYGYVKEPVQNSSTLKNNLEPSKKNNSCCQESNKESFSGIRNSQEYLTEMELNNLSFNNDSNQELTKVYQELQSSINEAKTDKDKLPNLNSYDIFTKQIIENFDSHNFSSPILNAGRRNQEKVLNEQINPSIEIYEDYLGSINQVNQNMYTLNDKVIDVNDQQNYLSNATVTNDNLVISDPYNYTNNNFDFEQNNNTKPNTIDGRINDNKEFIIQQSSILVLSTITMASLVIGLILIYK